MLGGLAVDAARWHYHVRVKLGVELEMPAAGGRYDGVVIGVRQLDDICSVVHWAAQQRGVLWLEIKHKVELQNFASSAILQGSAAVAGQEPSVRQVWEMGIRGEGQIVGVGDTGLDWDGCFFLDTKLSAPPFDGVAGPKHRKVVAYFRDDDDHDDETGHGTHVIGSIVGDALPDAPGLVREFSGVAKKAKVVVTDISPLSIPMDLSLQYFSRPYAVCFSRSKRAVGRRADGRTGGP